MNREFYYVLGIGIVLISFFIGYAAQSGRYQVACFAVVILLDFIIFPGEPMSRRPVHVLHSIYYFLGFSLDSLCSGRLYTADSAPYSCCHGYVSHTGLSSHSKTGVSLFSGMNILIDVIIPMIICALFSFCSILASLRYYKVESAKAEKSRRAADETEKSKDMFLMNMSHEIRTPMNAIMSAGEILLSKDISFDTRQNVHHITNACRALISTLDDLLVFSKTEDRI